MQTFTIVRPLSKFAIEITETASKTVIVEAETEEEAINKVRDAYYDADIVLDADNANIDAEFNNVSTFYDDIENEEVTVER